MSDNDNTQACADDTRPCVKGCGFYGSAQTGYMCSKCFKDTAGVTRASIESSTPSSSSSGSAAAAAILTQALALGEEGSASPLGAAASAASLGSVDLPQGPDATPSQSQTKAVVGMEAGSSSMSSSMGLSAAPSLTTKDLAAPATMEGMVAGGGEAAAATDAATHVTAPVVAKKNKNRCFVCSKKVGLTGIECRCEGVFCGVHRYPSQHACAFDHKEHDRANLKTTLTGGGQFAKMTDQL